MQHNNCIFKVFGLWLLFLPLPLFSMFNNITNRRKQQAAHKVTLKKIQNLTTVSALDQAIDDIKNKIYEELLIELEHITNEPSTSIKIFINEARRCMKKTLQKSYPLMQTIHEANLPSSLYKSMLTLLLKEKINPNNIHLHYILDQNEDEEDREKILEAETFDLNPLLFSSTEFIKPTINFYESLLFNTKAQQNFVCLHELSHILLRHSSIRPHRETTNLHSIMEREADIHAASKNITFAHAGKKARCALSGHHSKIIDSQNHCETMKIIYALMQKKEELS